MLKDMVDFITTVGPGWFRTFTAIVFGLLGIWFLVTLWLAATDKIGAKRKTGNLTVRPQIEFNIDQEKVLSIDNKGLVDIEDLQIFTSKYVLKQASLDSSLSEKRWAIKDFSKVGGAIESVALLKAGGGKEIIDLKTKSFLEFYDPAKYDPGKEGDTPFLTYYCFRIIFRNAATQQKYVHYRITSAVRYLPSLVENLDQSAIAGSPDITAFMLSARNIIKEHQLAIFGRDFEEYL